MLRLQELQVFNWGYAPFQRPLPIGDVTLLQGRNGSGKTTYLSAIALLLGVRHLPKRQSIDKFIYPGQDWGFIRAVTDNSPQPNGRRPFDSIIPTLEDSVTLGCLLERRQGGWQRSYYIVPGADFEPGPETVVRKDYQFKHDDYRRTLAHVGVRDALLNLLELGLYGLRDAARDPSSRFQFFLKLVGNEDIQHAYRDAREIWWKQRDETQLFEERLRKEESELGKMEETLKTLRRRRELKVRLERDRLFTEHAEVRTLREQLSEQEAALEFTNQSIVDLQRQSASHERVQQQFQQRQIDADARYTIWRQQRDQAERQFNESVAEASRASSLVEQQRDKIAALLSLPDISSEDAQSHRDKASAARDAVVARYTEIKHQLQLAQKERTELEANRIPLPPEVESYLQRLRQESIPYVLLADALEILDSEWLAAVEGALGAERFTVIVSAKDQQIRAQQIAESMRYRYWISPPNPTITGKPIANSLWAVVRVLDVQAQGWVYERLARVRRVLNVQEGHSFAASGEVTITPQAYSQEVRGGRSLYPRNFVCGRMARQTRLKTIRELITVLEDQLKLVNVERDAAERELEQARETLDQAIARQTLPVERRNLEQLTLDDDAKRQANSQAKATYQALKTQEDEWNNSRDALTAERTRLLENTRALDKQAADLKQKQEEVAKFFDQFSRRLRQLEPKLPTLSPELQEAFHNESHLTAEHYRERANKAETELQQLPLLEYEDIPEELYEAQKNTVGNLRQEVNDMRTREGEARAVFDRALTDFRQHVQEMFGQGMNRQFRVLCQKAGAQGDIIVSNDGEDHWGLEVKIGFDGKSRQTLESANLSQGQEVMTGLFLVLAALNAVGATPILLLDELMSTLDEVNAPLVLRSLKATQVQCLVATPHVRPQADAIADVIWGFQPMPETANYASPVAVLVRRSEL